MHSDILTHQLLLKIMPSVTITLTDTPSGGVSRHCSYSPAIGLPCSPAQQVAMEMIARTRHAYGIPPGHDAAPTTPPATAGDHHGL